MMLFLSPRSTGTAAVSMLARTKTRIYSMRPISTTWTKTSTLLIANHYSGTVAYFSSKSSSSSSNKKSLSVSSSFRPRRIPKGSASGSGRTTWNHPPKPRYFKSNQSISKMKKKGPKEPNDISKPIPKIDFTNIPITNGDKGEEEDDEDTAVWGPFLGMALKKTKYEQTNHNNNDNNNTSTSIEEDIEWQLQFMDALMSPPGSTEDLVAHRRAWFLEQNTWDTNNKNSNSNNTNTPNNHNHDKFWEDIDTMVEQERVQYMNLPSSPITGQDFEQGLQLEETRGTSSSIPPNQLAHGDWGEVLIRTDRVTKMWRGGRIETYRALVVGGNLHGCGGFGIGKSMEPEDAVAIASRMAKRNIYFVDRYRGQTLTRDLVGRQNSCKVYLRSCGSGLRGNPLCCEILQLFGITNVVAKAHGNRNPMNVVRATYKALLTHESLDEIAMKRGLRLMNLQKAKRLQI